MIDEIRIPLGRRGLATAMLLGLALTGCTRPEGLDKRQDVISSRLDVAPFYSEAYEGRLDCPGCGHGRADSELVLYRERRTGTPAGYQLNQRYPLDPADRRSLVETSHHGRWSIMQNGASPRDQPVYRFEPDDPTRHVFLLEQVDRDTLMARGGAGQTGVVGLRRSVASARGDLSVTEADSGLPIAIQVGQTLTVSLAADASGRFDWRLVAPPDGALEPLGSPMRVAAGQVRQQVENDSTAVWQFLGSHPGEIVLRFELSSLSESLISSSRVVRYPVRVQ
ncbi:protease inhibitor I42 family protein [Salinicola corii]|uniref:Protease inhibitor I42 family protein n=1 Tax=Salinicola corii TaxID=2606937 RepID=A0A640WC96_9GAMM|nr:protease inhibitor I42 family protein [Salinicola corii]KAA0016485.1 protease inhibitor I42 family protein [Salinicola corii]